MANNTQEGGQMMNSTDHFAKILDKLTDSFDDFKERLIRIEENVKTVNEVKREVDLMALKVQAVEESTKSAHKRMDKVDKIVFWVGTLIIGAVILAVLSVVLINKN